jgi:hypothetical protein
MKAKTMKAKNQKLLRQFFNYLAKDGTVMNHSKEEAQQVLDQFIDHQERKKKSKFGSDKEVVKLKEEPQEKTFEEWKAIYPIGSKARVVGNTMNHDFKIGSIQIVDGHYQAQDLMENSKAFGIIAMEKDHAGFDRIHFCDLEPIQEPSFKVGDKVESISGGFTTEKGLVVKCGKGEQRVYFYDVEEFDWKIDENLKLLPND